MMSKVALSKVWSARCAIAILAGCLLVACEKSSDAASIADAMPNATEAQREMIRRMEKTAPPTLNGVQLYTGPERTPTTKKGLTIVGYNYTDSAITNFSVGGAGAGNIEVSSRSYSYGGGACCAPIPQEKPLPIPVDIKWQRDGIGERPWCKQTVLLTGPMPKEANYFEVHFYQDGTIQVAITDYPSRPRVLMDRYSPALRKANGNVNNDTQHARCGDE
ncbi:DUF3304 domain-containing protein [Ralstonia sp. 1138]|uniref:DUF3304 domain-containing protein n=1 Tax=Ralstonia sp. 1138 TaxID=3156423 RepID=UPI00339AF848